MEITDKRRRKCFTFIWKLENISYCEANRDYHIESPSFTVDEINGMHWKLALYPSNVNGLGYIGFFLRGQDGNEGEEIPEIDCELAFLSLDGTVLHSLEVKKIIIAKDGHLGTFRFAWRNEVFFERKSEFLAQDTLTASCRIWKKVGEMSKDVECFARTRIVVERRSFLWSIENFSTLKDDEKRTFEIKSLKNGEKLMSLELFDETIYAFSIRLKIIPDFRSIKICTLKLSIVNASKNKIKCFQDVFWNAYNYDKVDSPLYYMKSELMEKKDVYLPNDELSLWCECTFSFGEIEEAIEAVKIDRNVLEKKESHYGSVNLENEFAVPTGILIEDFKSMLNDSILCDIKLKTGSHTYPAHKCILSVRSPVFKAMFSSDMKEKVNNCVDLEDLNDDTVLRMLRYIYSADVGELEWSSATDLYEAADKYQILNLKDICSSYLKSNLSSNNACKALVLADLHQDEGLKAFVRDFIFSRGEDIINSEEWEQLAETNLKLAYETLRLKFKK